MNNITYSWEFNPLECVPSANGITNVVKTVHWRYHGTDGTVNTSVYGSVGLESPDPDDYIQYANLTMNTVTEWVVSALAQSNTTVESLQNSINTQITDIINPPIVSNIPPWANNNIS